MKTDTHIDPPPPISAATSLRENSVYLVDRRFSLENLRRIDRQRPKPGACEVLLRIRAVSLNFRDLDILRGTYPGGNYNLPFVPTSDAAGEVLEVGEAVTQLKIGDRVMPNFWQGWPAGDVPPVDAATLGGPLPGTLQRYAVFPAANLVRIPAYLTDEEASTLPIAALTAWNALVVQGGIKPGDNVLVEGTGGVSIFALQIAKLAGARVIVTSSSDAKLERARTLGADATINYKAHPEWSKKVLELTERRGVEHLIEVGGANTINQALDSVALSGNVYVIGYLAGLSGGMDPFKVLKRKARVCGVLVGSQSSFGEMNRAFALHHVKPVVDRVFEWNEAPDAIRYLESAQHFGKIVIRVE